jgi:uncharacterized caspase-like protein
MADTRTLGLARLLAALCIFLAAAVPALAKSRIALVVGNGAYGSVPQLDNPVPDAELIARTLRQTGFEVTLLTDADQVTLVRAIAQFGRDLRAAGEDTTGLFYYAGHGVQSFGANYLLPTDLSLTDAADLPLVAIEAQSVLRQMASARNRTNIVILDACRDNPFETIPDMNDNGLAEMKAPTGTFLAYATAPGSVALDGDGGNSPFTTALAARIGEPGLPIEQLFKDVRVAVLEETGGAQVPWDTSSLTGDFAFVPAQARSVAQIAEDQLWTSVKASRDPVQVLLFLRGNPGSAYEADARALLAELMSTEIPETPVVPETAPPPVAAGPDDTERAMIETARSSGALADYEAYIAAYPEGAYAELAAFEIRVLREQMAAADPAAVPAAPAMPNERVTFAAPIDGDISGVSGRSIADLITGSPHFPPIEGLPDAVWKDKTCNACHEWTQERLCTQASTYLAEAGARSLSKQHPYGGAFKRTLRSWAEGGCE